MRVTSFAPIYLGVLATGMADPGATFGLLDSPSYPGLQYIEHYSACLDVRWFGAICLGMVALKICDVCNGVHVRYLCGCMDCTVVASLCMQGDRFPLSLPRHVQSLRYAIRGSWVRARHWRHSRSSPHDPFPEGPPDLAELIGFARLYDCIHLVANLRYWVCHSIFKLHIPTHNRGFSGDGTMWRCSRFRLFFKTGV